MTVAHDGGYLSEHVYLGGGGGGGKSVLKRRVQDLIWKFEFEMVLNLFSS